MGWASANAIFDRTAHALIQCRTESYIVTAVLAELIDALRDADWDTLNESMDDFQDVPSVQAAFRQAVPDYFEDYGRGSDDPQAELDVAFARIWEETVKASPHEFIASPVHGEDVCRYSWRVESERTYCGRPRSAHADKDGG